MIKITPPQKKRSGWIAWAVAGSFVIHGGLFFAGTEYASHRDKEHYEVSRIEFSAPPPPEPIQESEPEPEPEPIVEPPPPEEKPQPKPRAPRPNTHKAPPPPPEAPPPKPVFGATANSVGSGDSGVAIRVGNTLETVMEKQAPPKKVAPLAPVQDAPQPKPTVKNQLKPVPVYSLSQAPKFETRIEPVYPAQARQDEVEGVVQLEVLIDAQGQVRDVRVLKTPGGGLEKAAIAALTKSRFAPGILNGKPVPVKIKIPYRFILDS